MASHDVSARKYTCEYMCVCVRRIKKSLRERSKRAASMWSVREKISFLLLCAKKTKRKEKRTCKSRHFCGTVLEACGIGWMENETLAIVGFRGAKLSPVFGRVNVKNCTANAHQKEKKKVARRKFIGITFGLVSGLHPKRRNNKKKKMWKPTHMCTKETFHKPILLACRFGVRCKVPF